MPCGEGYPNKPCPFGFEGRVTRATCGVCKHFIPPQYILTWCMLFDRDGVVCKKPKAACETCPEKRVPQHGRRVVDSPVDWRDPESVRKYWRERAKLNPDARTEAMLAFLERQPDYFKQYREANRDKMRAANKRYYEKKKQERAREQGEGEVQRDSHGPRVERDQDLPASRPDDDAGSGDA